MINISIRKKERSLINHLRFHLQKQENEEQNTPKAREEITKIRTKINEIESKKEKKKKKKKESKEKEREQRKGKKINEKNTSYLKISIKLLSL